MKGTTVASKESSAKAGGHEHSRTSSVVLVGDQLADEFLLRAFQAEEQIDPHGDRGGFLAEVPERDLHAGLEAGLVGGHLPLARIGKAKTSTSCRMPLRRGRRRTRRRWTMSESPARIVIRRVAGFSSTRFFVPRRIHEPSSSCTWTAGLP